MPRIIDGEIQLIQQLRRLVVLKEYEDSHSFFSLHEKMSVPSLENDNCYPFV